METVTLPDATIAVNLARKIKGEEGTEEKPLSVIMGSVYTEKIENGKVKKYKVPNLTMTVYKEDEEYQKVEMGENNTFEYFVPAGTYSLSFEAEGFVKYTFTFKLQDRDTQYLSVCLTSEDSFLPLPDQAPTPNDGGDGEIVTDAYTATLTDRRYNILCCYHIPKFDLPNNMADKFNDKIYSQMHEILQRDVLDVHKEYGYVNVGKMNYAWGQSKNIASVIVETELIDTAFSEHYIYNVNTETGEEASRAELLAVFGLTEESFEAQAKEMLKSKFETINSWAIESVGQSEYNKKLNSTISDENIKKAKLYINEKGQLCIMISFYGFAGPECTNSCLSLETSDWQYVPMCAEHN